MKPFVFVYCEGSDTKIVVTSKEKEGIRILRTATLNSKNAPQDSVSDEAGVDEFNLDGISGDFSIDEMGGQQEESTGGFSNTEIGNLARNLEGINLNAAKFIPIGTEPGMNYHIYDGPKEKDRHKQILAITTDIEQTKNIYVAPDAIDYIPYNDKSLIAAFFENNIPCVDVLSQLAAYNKKKNYKIQTIKSADLSLAYYVAKTVKFFPEDYTLIIYTGKEYSKLIFLEGNNLKHIGATLDIGTKNLSTYDVYFSKILLEMENGNIPQLDNVILCGEDRSENLILSFYGTFPEANVTELEFNDFNTGSLSPDQSAKLPDFAIPLAVATEFYDEQDKKYRGINILPRYIVETQKILQFGLLSYALMPLIFLTAFLFTYLILENDRTKAELDTEIARLTRLQQENQALMDQIYPLSDKIAGFDVTKSILDSATAGTEIWGQTLERISDFIERRRSFWISSIQNYAPNQIRINGYSLSRSVLTEFTDYYDSAILENITFEPLRENNAFSFNIILSIDGSKSPQLGRGRTPPNRPQGGIN
jgi:Tfp pilus assembly protein PilN